MMMTCGPRRLAHCDMIRLRRRRSSHPRARVQLRRLVRRRRAQIREGTNASRRHPPRLPHARVRRIDSRSLRRSSVLTRRRHTITVRNIINHTRNAHPPRNSIWRRGITPRIRPVRPRPISINTAAAVSEDIANITTEPSIATTPTLTARLASSSHHRAASGHPLRPRTDFTIPTPRLDHHNLKCASQTRLSFRHKHQLAETTVAARAANENLSSSLISVGEPLRVTEIGRETVANLSKVKNRASVQVGDTGGREVEARRK